MGAAVTAEPKSKKSKSDLSSEGAPAPESSFQLEAMYGAPAGMPMFLDIGLQRKLAVGAVDDPLEREEEPPVTTTIHRRVSGNGNGSGASEAPPIVHQALSSPGQPLHASVRPLMESRFGRDFGDVRVHTDSLAAKSAGAVNALAYTAGKDVVFAPGQYSPQSDQGKRLLAHELTHVIQEGTRDGSRVVRRQPPPPGAAPPPEQATAPPPTAVPPPTTLQYYEWTFTDNFESLKAEVKKIAQHSGADAPRRVLSFFMMYQDPTLGCQPFVEPSDACKKFREAKYKIYPVLEKAVPAVEQEIKDTQNAFLSDVGAAATQNLWDNRSYILARKETLGLQPGSSKDPLSEAQKAEWRHQIQDMAWQVWEFKQSQAQLRQTIVGYVPMAFAPPSPIYFNPDYPQHDQFKGVHGTRPEWADLKLAWDLISAEIARIAAKYPEIYGALASEKPDDELLSMSRLIPGAFEKNTARLLDEMLARIDDTQKKLGTSIEYLDLQPLVKRLRQGGAAPSGRKWNVGFDKWAVDTLVGDREEAQKAADTAATALEIIGLLVATFASGGLALLVGGTLAVGIPVARGISDWSKANELDQAAKSTPKAGTDIVAQAQADSLKAKAVGEIIRGVFNAITLGGAAAWGAVRGAMTAAKLGRIGELSGAEAADLLQKALTQLGAAKTVTSSGKTIEELLAIVGEDAAASGPLRAYNAELLAKPFSEITPQELAASEALQSRVYDMAVSVQARQQAFADQILSKLAIKGGTAKSILKRPDLKGFVEGVIGKTERGGYDRISRMDDMVRGRFDLPDQKSVDAVAKALREQSTYEVVEVTEPRVAGGVVKYPRYHVILRDAETGLRHEWQVGTEALSKLYEEPGIAIPEELATAAEQMGKEFAPNLHDIEYDVFQSINKTNPAVAQKYGLPDFIRKVAQASQKAGAQGAAFKDLPEVSSQLHQEAGSILAKLVQGEGAEWVAQFFH